MSTDSTIKLKRIEPPEQIILDTNEYFTLLDLLNNQIIKNMKQAETDTDLGKRELAGMEYLQSLHKKLLPYQTRGHVELRLLENWGTSS